jgi:cytochrome c-type biogenesis protein CcsB
LKLDLWLLAASSLAYALASGAAVAHWVRPQMAAERFVVLVLGLGAVPHLGALVARGVELGAFPIASVHDGLAAFAFLAAVLAVVVARKGGIPQVAWMVAPLITTLTLITMFVTPTASVPEALRYTGLGVHVGLALIGDAAIVIAGIVASVYLVQERRLKPKKKGAPRSPTQRALPPLDLLDRTSQRLIQIGFPFMTLGLLSGSLYGKEVWGTYWNWEPRTTVSFLVWLLYALLIQARWISGWRGRKAALLTVMGVVAILIAFVGFGLLGVGSHGRDYLS